MARRKPDEIVVRTIVWPSGSTTRARRVMRMCRSTTHTTPAGEVAIFGQIRHEKKRYFVSYEPGGIARVLAGDAGVLCARVYSSDAWSSPLT